MLKHRNVGVRVYACLELVQREIPRELMMHFIGNLYGMVQASRQFWMLLRDYMVDVNKGAFAQLWSDPCVFYKMVNGELMIVWTYVDDLGALVVEDTMWHTFYRDISSVFEVEEIEVSWFLTILYYQ